MANFKYDIKYFSQKERRDLCKDIVDAIGKINVNGLEIKSFGHPEFNAAYKMKFDEYNRVHFGIRASSGEVDGTEHAKIDIAGTEVNILRAKSVLLKEIKGLELL
jgi:hypothetical protein